MRFVPTAQRMQTVSHGGIVKGHRINLKTVFVKGLLWALIGAFMGFAISELADKSITSDAAVATLTGHSELADYYNYTDRANDVYLQIYTDFQAYCNENGLDTNSEDNFTTWMDVMPTEDEELIDEYLDYYDKADDVFNSVYLDFTGDDTEFQNILNNITLVGSALWSAIIALFIGLFMGIGEGIYYGSGTKAVKYAFIGAGISIVMGFISGYIAQWMYGSMTTGDASVLTYALVRGLGWAIMGVGNGLAIGLIKPGKKRILFCMLGGLVGAFLGGFLFDYILSGHTQRCGFPRYRDCTDGPAGRPGCRAAGAVCQAGLAQGHPR